MEDYNINNIAVSSNNFSNNMVLVLCRTFQCLAKHCSLTSNITTIRWHPWSILGVIWTRWSMKHGDEMKKFDDIGEEIGKKVEDSLKDKKEEK